MATKRKDLNGRILATGESQRKDGIYQYRFTDYYGKRQTLYATNLSELRKKEQDINILNRAKTDFTMGRLTVYQLVEMYVATKADNVRRSTQAEYEVNLAIIRNCSFSPKQINDVSCYDAKRWMSELKESGRSYYTVKEIKSVLAQAFQMAVENDYIIKNPFDFKLGGIINNDTSPRIALTDEQYQRLLGFIDSDKVCSKYFNQIALLGETGMRVSELCGLTVGDIDFANNRIHVQRQIIQDKDGEYYVERPKTKKGTRYIPMTALARQCTKQAILEYELRRKNVVVDGVNGFLFLTNRDHPITGDIVSQHLRSVIQRHNRKYREEPDMLLPNVTPHILRHTFCTRIINSGVNVKTAQYLMGHASANTTLNIYTHDFIEVVEQDFYGKVSSNSSPKIYYTTTPFTTPIAR